jgi:hypothetical protein
MRRAWLASALLPFWIGAATLWRIGKRFPSISKKTNARAAIGIAKFNAKIPHPAFGSAK